MDSAKIEKPLTKPVISVVMPIYNEALTLETIIHRVLESPLVYEIVAVDDGSTDGSTEQLKRFAEKYPRIKAIYQKPNRGKGAALREAFKRVSGEIVIVQDADLEYDPQEYSALINPIVEGKADVVYGSRFLAGEHRVLYFWHFIANRILTTLSNMFTDLNLTDMETCYKAFRRDVIEGLEIEEERFGVEPEITAKVAKMGLRIYEIPISYAGRTYEEGKKITWNDALSALRCIVKYGAFSKNSKRWKISRKD
ncbi:MAG: glycosyltransferase family 2 protein [Myxococcota bacterium]